MILINEKYKGIETFNNDHHAQMFWTYDFVKGENQSPDFFLKSCLLWQNLISDAYQLKIGDAAPIWVPYNYFILLGDFDSGLDCISPNEILYRDFQVVTFANTLEESSMILKDMKVVGYEEEKTFVVPFEKTIYPVLAGDRVVLVSSKDFYNKIKNITIAGMI